MAKDSPDISRLLDRARAQLGMLITQFLLGMSVNLLGEPESAFAKLIRSILLGLHILVAIGIVVGAHFTVRAAKAAGGVYLRQARWGNAAVGIAVLGGILTVTFKSDWWSFVMAIGFIAAFAIYGLLYAKTRSATATDRSGN